MERGAWGGDASDVPWWRVALGYARVVLRDRYVRGVVLALAAWAAVRWQRPELTAWADAVWAALATLLGAGLAVERVRSGAAAEALDTLMLTDGDPLAADYGPPRMRLRVELADMRRELWRARSWAAWGRRRRHARRDLLEAVEAIIDGRRFTKDG